MRYEIFFPKTLEDGHKFKYGKNKGKIWNGLRQLPDDDDEYHEMRVANRPKHTNLSKFIDPKYYIDQPWFKYSSQYYPNLKDFTGLQYLYLKKPESKETRNKRTKRELIALHKKIENEIIEKRKRLAQMRKG